MLRPGTRVRINKPTGPESSRHGQVGEVVAFNAEKPERATWVMLPGESGPRWYYREELEEVAGMARFKVGDWVRRMTRECEWLVGKVTGVDGDCLTIDAVEGPANKAGLYLVDAREQEPAPPPVGERVRCRKFWPGCEDFGCRGCCECAAPDFDPSLWCPCTPEPATTDRRVYFAADGIRPNATDELSVYCPHYSVRGRACLECRNRAARARKARGGGA